MSALVCKIVPKMFFSIIISADSSSCIFFVYILYICTNVSLFVSAKLTTNKLCDIVLYL